MASNNTGIPGDAILNPYTTLAFLPPDIAEQYQILSYVYVAVLAVSSMPNQVTLVLKSYAFRLIRGIGLWHCRRSMMLFVKQDSVSLISRISCPGRRYMIPTTLRLLNLLLLPLDLDHLAFVFRLPSSEVLLITSSYSQPTNKE
jgi:hypothetical protein